MTHHTKMTTAAGTPVAETRTPRLRGRAARCWCRTIGWWRKWHISQASQSDFASKKPPPG